MFRKPRSTIKPTYFLGYKLNLYGIPEREEHTPEEIVPLLPKTAKLIVNGYQTRFFKNSSSENLANDHFVWEGEKLVLNPEVENEKDQEILYVLVSKDHKNVYKLLKEKEFLDFAVSQIQDKSRSFSPTC
jgi:hypothetical protein